jgi:UDP-glucose-4-epimerase GalE
MIVLVSGGAGYIGSHTAKLLRARGHTPVVLDDLSAGHREFVRFGPFDQGDVRDEAFVADVLTRRRVEAVIHFAAKIEVEESVRQPEAYFSTILGGTRSLLAAMQRAGVRRLVFSSTCAVYGPTRAERIAEDHPLAPASPYAQAKLQAEQAIAAADFGLRWACLRYFNVIGADPDRELWEWHEPETHVVPNLLRALREGRPFTLYGTDHPTPDGTAIRDYVDVLDLAAVHLEALERLESVPGCTSNVGAGRGLSVRELLAAVRAVALQAGADGSIAVEERPRRPGDVPRLVADDTYLRSWSETARRGLRPVQDSLRAMLAAGR